MGTISYRANLSAATYPMTVAEGGRTVIIPGPDNNYDRRVDPQGEQRNAGIPQALYLENVIPTGTGYQSVGIKQTGTLPPRYTAGPGYPIAYQVLQFFFGSASTPKRLTVAFREVASYYDHIATDLQTVPLLWTQGTGDEPANPSGSGITPAGLTTAYVRGINYLSDGVKLYTVENPAADVVDITDITGTVTGITWTDVVAICSCANYLIALLSDNTIAWSSTTTPTDFSASLVSGAGSTIPADLKSAGTFLTEAPNGFYIYSATGVIYAAYTGNARYPFKFTAVENSGGYTFRTQVSYDKTKVTQYAIDDAKIIRAITPSGAQIIAAEVSTFLERNTRYDTFDTSTNQFGRVFLFSVNSIFFVQDRYILLDIGGVFIFYDTALQRYGKIKAIGTVVTQQDGVDSQLHFIPVNVADEFDTSVLSMDIYDNTIEHSGVLVLGKFQYVRSKMMQLHGVELEGIEDTSIIPSPNISCTLLPSLDGRNFDTPVNLTPFITTGGLVHYPVHHTATNHTLVIKGTFNLSTVQLKFSPRA